MDLPIVDLQGFAKRILELLGIDSNGTCDLELQKLADGSVRILKEDSSHG